MGWMNLYNVAAHNILTVSGERFVNESRRQIQRNMNFIAN